MMRIIKYLFVGLIVFINIDQLKSQTFTITTNVTNVSPCSYSANGTFLASVDEAGNYRYILYNSLFAEVERYPIAGFTTDISHTFLGLIKDTYYIEITKFLSGTKYANDDVDGPDDINVTFNPSHPHEVCLNNDFTFNNSVIGGSGTYTAYDWTVGDATRTDPDNVLNPDFDASVAGNYNLIIEVTDDLGCFNQSSIDVTVTDPPTLDAGSNEETCEDVDFDLSTSGTAPSASNYSTLLWDDGVATGSFDNSGALQPTYTAPVGFSGIITLTLTANPNGSCSAVDDNMTLTVTAAPVVNAGSNESTCINTDFDLSTSGTVPSASNYSTLLWDDGVATGSFDNSSALQPIYTPPAGFTGIITLTLTANGNGTCIPVNDNMTLTVVAAPTVDAGSNETTCINVDFDLSTSGTAPSASNYSTLLWDDGVATGSFDNSSALQPTYTPPAGFTGIITLTLTANGNANCSPVNDNMTLTVVAAPTVNAGSNETTCINVDFDLSTSGTVPSASNYSTLLWDDGVATGSFDNSGALQPIYTPPAGYTGLITLTLTANGNANCSPVNDNMTLTVVAAPVVNAGSNETTCINVDFDLSTSGTAPSASNYSTLLWDDGVATGSFDNSSALQPTYTPPAGFTGIITLTLTANGNANCSPVNDNMTLTVVAAPIVNAGSNEETCEDVDFDLSTSGTAPSASNYSTLLWDDGVATGSFDNSSALQPTYTPPAGFTGIITLTLTANGNANCSPVNDNMTLTVTAAPVVNAGSNESTCINTDFDLSTSGTAPSASNYSTLLWDDGVATGSFDNSSALQPIYTPPAGFTGIITLTLTANGNGTCTPVNDNMTLTVVAAPTVDAGSNEETCEDVDFDLSTSGTAPSASNYSTLLWDDGVATGSFDNSSALQPTYTPPAGFTGIIALTLTANGNANCSPVNDNMTLTVTAAPVVNAGSNESTCINTDFDLSTSGTVPSASNYSTLLWDDGVATGSFDNSSALQPIYTPPAGFTGIITLTLTANGNGTCIPVNDNMTLTVVAAPTVDAGSNETTCINVDFDLSTSGTAPSASNYSTLLWDDGVATGSFDNSSALQPTYTPPAGFTGIITLTLTANGNANCSPVNDNMTLTVVAAPTVNAGSNETTCINVDFDLSTSGTVPSASNYSTLLWDDGVATGSFDNSGALQPIYTPPAGYTGLITLTLTANGNANCSPVNDNMTLTVVAAPVVNAGSNETTCINVDFDLSTSGTAPSASNYSTLLWDDGVATGSFDNSSALQPTYTPPAGFTGIITLTLTANGNANCSPVNDNMTLTVVAAPTVNAGSNETTCINVDFDLSTSGTVPSASNYSTLLWDDGVATGSFDNSGALQPIYTPPAGYTGLITLTLTANGNANCSPVNDNMTLTVVAAPVVNAGSNETTCINVDFDLSTSGTAPSASNYSTLLWDDGVATGSFDNSSALQPTYTPPAGFTGIITLTLTANGNANCSPVNDNMTLTVVAAPIVNAGSNEETCEDVDFDLSTSGTAPSASNYSTLLWDDGVATGSFDNSSALQPTYTPPAGFTGIITLTLTANGNANCSPVNDNMTLTVTAAPVVNAGSNESTCINTDFDLSTSGTAPSASNYSTLLWDDGVATGSFDNSSALQPIYTPPAGFTGIITLTLTANGNGTCTPVNDNMTLTVNSAPSTGLDVQNDFVCDGNDAVVDLNGSVIGINYTLRTNPGGLPIAGPFPGMGGTINFTVPDANINIGNNQFQVYSENAFGCSSIQADIATVVVYAMPNINNSVNDPIICNGQTATITVGTSQIGFNYTLRLNADNSTIAGPSNGNGGNLNFNASPVLNTTYNVLASRTYPNATCSAQLTDLSNVTVNPLPNNALAASDDIICFGQAATITVTASEPGINYYLRLSDNSVVDGPIAGGGDINLTHNPVITTTYNILAQNAITGCSVQLTDQPSVTVDPLPDNTLAVSDDEICNGQTATIRVSNTVSGTNYTLRLNSDNSTIDGPFNGTDGNLDFSATPLSTTIYNVYAENTLSGCNTQLTDLATVTVNPLPDDFIDVENDVVCQGDDASVEVRNTENTVSYQLRTIPGNVNVGSPLMGNGGSIFITVPSGSLVLGNQQFNIFATSNDGCGVQLTDISNVTVNALPTITLGANPEVCSGNVAANLTYSGTTQSPDEYSIDFDAVAEGEGFADVNNIPLLGSPITITVPALAAAGIYNATLTVTNTTTGCISLGNAITVTINAIPTITLGPDPEACSGEITTNLTYSGTTQSPDEFSIDFDAVAEGEGFADINNSVLSGSPIAIVVPALATPGIYNANLFVNNTTTGCVSAGYPITITVHSLPTITLGANPSVCSGEATANLTYSGTTQSPDLYSIDFNGAAETEGFTDVTNVALSGSPIIINMPALPTAGIYNATLTVTNSTTGCTSAGDAITVTVIALPTITLGANPEVCSGNVAANLTYSGTTQSPDEYSIDFDAVAEGEGFADVNNLPLLGSPITITVPALAAAGIYNATLTVTNTTTGCISLGNAITVTINAIPTITLGPDPEACSGEITTNLTYSGTTQSPDEFSIDFDAVAEGEGFADINNSVLSGSPIAIVVPALATPGIYNATLFVNNTTTGCVSAGYPITITVHSLPTITLGANPSVCSGEATANLTYSGTTQSPDLYSIDFNGAAETEGFTDVTNAALSGSPIIINMPALPTAGIYNATLTVTNSTTGCTSAGDAITVTVVALPTITLGANPEVCSGNIAANLTYSGTTQSPDEYSIDFDAVAEGEGFADVNNLPLLGSPITITVPALAAAGIYNATLIVNNTTTGCISTTYPISLTIHSLPSPSILVTSGDTNICLGNDDIYSTEAGMSGYNWFISGTPGVDYNNLTGNTTSQSLNLDWLTAGTFKISVNYTDGNGCTATNPDTTYIVVTPGPSIVTQPIPVSACEGDTAIFIVEVTGTPPITYEWVADFGSGNVPITGLNPDFTGYDNDTLMIANLDLAYAGAYTCIVSGGCSTPAISIPANLTVLAVPAITFAGLNSPYCENVSADILTGSAAPAGIFTGNGITDFGDGTAEFNPIITGTYNISYDVLNGNGCWSHTSQPVTVQPAPDATLVVSTDTICSGETAVIEVFNSISGFNYTLRLDADSSVIGAPVNGDGGTISFSVAPVVTTVYHILAQNTTTLCTSVLNTRPEVYVSPAIITTTTGDTVSCPGGTDGVVHVSAIGGIPGYTYQWYYDKLGTDIPGATADSLDNRSLGRYYIVVTDSEGCTMLDSADVQDPSPVTISNITITDPTCPASSNGEVSFTATGGRSPYTHSFNGSPFTTDTVYSGLLANSYTLVTRDAKGCEISTPVVLTDPLPLQVDTIFSTSISCFGFDDGTVTVISRNGTGLKQFILYLGNTEIDTLVHINSVTFNGLASGSNYWAKITDSCVSVNTDSVNVIIPSSINIISAIGINMSCHGDSNDSIKIEVAGGSLPLIFMTYSADMSTRIDSSAIAQNPGAITGLGVGSYRVVVTDINSCSYDTTGIINIVEPAQISLVKVLVLNVSCGDSVDDGRIILNGSFTQGPRVFSLYNLTDPDTITNTNGDFTGLAAATYEAWVTDSKMCSDRDTILIPGAPAIIIDSVKTTQTQCYGSNDGSITIYASGGVGILDYSIDGGSFQSGSNVFNNLNNSSHIIIIRDDNLCTRVQNIVVPYDTTPVDPIIIDSAVFTDARCYKESSGSIVIVAHGGQVSPLNYYLSDTTPPNTTGVFNSMPSGIYGYYIQESGRNCIVFGSPDTIKDPEPMKITSLYYEYEIGNVPGALNVQAFRDSVFVGGNLVLNDTTLSFTISSPTYPAGFYDTLSTTDTLWTVRQDTAYTITVMDTNACKISMDTTFEMLHFDNFISTGYFNLDNDSVNCFGDEGEVAFSVDISQQNGMQPPFGFTRFLITDTSGFIQPIEIFDTIFSGWTKLPAGTYYIHAYDTNHRHHRDTIRIYEPLPLTVILDPSPANCPYPQTNDGFINSLISGGTSPYKLFWPDTVGPYDSIQTMPGITRFDNLYSGIYFLKVVDKNGCSSYDKDTVKVRQIINITNFTRDNWFCPDEDEFIPSINAFVITKDGNIPPTAVFWEPNDYNITGTNSLEPVISIEQDTFYTITVISDSNCVATDTVKISLFTPQPFSILNGDTVSAKQGTIVTLEAQEGFEDYFWYPSNNLSSDSARITDLTVQDVSIYHAFAYDTNYCILEDSVYIKLATDIHPVTGFTPDDDGINDFWEIAEAQFYGDQIEVFVFNRWGQKLYYTKGYSDDDRWNGKKNNKGKFLPVGTYYYYIRVNGKEVAKGPVTIVK